MKYKLTESGNIAADAAGQPIVIDEAGKEFGIDAIGAQAKMSTITTESNERRKALGEANTKLEAFAGIEDPKAALDAIQKVGSYDKDLTTQLDNLKTTINTAWEAKEQAWNTEKETLNGNLFQANVLSNFGTSKVASTLILTPKIAAKEFGSSFNADGTANDAAGNVIFDPAKPGTPADFDTALGILIEQHPDKDSILRSNYVPGGDSHSKGDGGAGTATKTSHQRIMDGLAARQK